MSPSKPCKRGAPPGNLNALKHGYYSPQIKNAVLNDFDPERFSGLKEEIGLIRFYIRRVVDFGQDVNELESALGLLRGLCMATTTLTRLLRTPKVLASDDDPLQLALRRANGELSLTLGDSPDPPSNKLHLVLLHLNASFPTQELFRVVFSFFITQKSPSPADS